jgi:hypothetical protein
MPERERAPHECLPGQLDMWKDYATHSATARGRRTSHRSRTWTACSTPQA